jgi:Co/Zn/Cd efflux system component
MTLVQKRYLKLFGVTLGVIAIELAGMKITRSYGIFSDAMHLLGDLAPFGIGLCAAFGFLDQDQGVLAGKLIYIINSFFLVGVVALITSEGMHRLAHPVEISGSVFFFAVIGLLGSVAQLYYAQGLGGIHHHEGVHHSQIAHLTADIASSLAVLAGAAIVVVTGDPRADTLAALFAAAIILYALWEMIRHSPLRAHSHDH